MTSHGILVQNAVAAMTLDVLNRSAVAGFDVDNGNVFRLTGLSTTAGEAEVWTASTPASGGISNLWMAYEPEVVTTISGTNKYKGIDSDVRNFYNAAGDVFTAFKPQVGDIITLTGDALDGTKTGSTLYVVATAGTSELTWAASAVSGLSLRLIETTYVSIGTGSIGTNRVTAYKFEVTAIA